MDRILKSLSKTFVKFNLIETKFKKTFRKKFRLLLGKSRRVRACKMKVEETSMKAKKWTFLLTSIATLALVTAYAQSTSNTTTSNTATSTTSTTNAKKTSYFTDKDYDTSYDESLHQL